MLELDDTSSNEENVAGADGGSSDNSDQTDQTSGDGSDASGGSSSEEAKGDQQAIDASKITPETFAELLKRDDLRDVVLESEPIKRAVQSAKDQELAREKRRLADEQRKRVAAEEAEKRAAARQQAIAEGDKDKLFELETSELEETKALSKSATKVAQIIEDVVRTNPEFRVLGEDKIDEIYQKVGDERGNVVDFTIELAKARRQQEVEEATKAATKDIDDKVNSAIEAALVEAGVKVRSDEASGDNTPSEEISSGGAPRKNIKSMTYTEASEAYGAGEISWAQFKPFKEKHEEEKRF